MEEQEPEQVIFTRDGLIDQFGEAIIVGPDEANIEHQAKQFFLEESYSTLKKKFTDENIMDELQRAMDCYGSKTAAIIIGCEEDKLFQTFHLPDDRWKQHITRKLAVARYWTTANRMAFPPEVTIGSKGDDAQDAVGHARHILYRVHPELGNDRNVAEYIHDQHTILEVIETLDSILWA